MDRRRPGLHLGHRREARLKDLHVTIAALLVAHSCNVGYTPVIGAADALKYGRLSHVDQTYLRLATYRAANATLIDYQAAIPLAQAWGGGLVASVDGMRFVVPVPSVYAQPNPKYFGRRGGATWLNMINDQAAGLGGKVVAGTPRDLLYVLDVLYDRDGGKRPEMIVTDTASYSDIVFGLLPYMLRAGAPPVETYLRLRVASGLSAKTVQAAEAGLPNTWYGVTVLRGDAPVGMGRVIGDGGCFFQIVDICVVPEHQGRGLGKRIMAELVGELERRAPSGAYVSLIADGDAQFLYEKFGFRKTAPASVGMHRTV